MGNWQPSSNYTKIVEANRTYYASSAAEYEATETCVSDSKIQAKLEKDLDEVLRLLNHPFREVHVLDACGGSGNVSCKLLTRGVNVTLVDVSQEMLAIFREKCATAAPKPEAVHMEIAEFLAANPARFDLVVFSSALHHLADILGVLQLTYDALAPNGLLFSLFDPTAHSQQGVLTRALLGADYCLFKVSSQTADLPLAVRRRLQRMLAGSFGNRKGEITLNAATAGMLAEYHVETGIDDLALAADLQRMGFQLVWHDRRAHARHRWIARLLQSLGAVTYFQLLLRKPPSAD